MATAHRTFRRLWLGLALAALAASPPTWAGTALIYVTNSAGDSIHVIDPATNKVVQEIKGVEAAHGIAPAPDGSRVYVSNEADTTLDVFDRGSGSLVKKVPLSNHPNNIAVTKNGDRILVGIARGRRHRRQHADPDQEHSGERTPAQHLCDA
jgi:YVTN family beta-propeller protein